VVCASGWFAFGVVPRVAAGAFVDVCDARVSRVYLPLLIQEIGTQRRRVVAGHAAQA
jgi:hypothetical protein